MRENPVVPRNEQETVIQISRDTEIANIYTTDSRYINKLDKIYNPTRIIKNKRRIVAKEYEVPAKLISFRSKVTKLNLTDEQRKKLSDEMKKRRKEES